MEWEVAMRNLECSEIEAVSGGEILVSPGQLGIALTDNTLIVITGTVEAGAGLATIGALAAAGSFGFELGSLVVDYTGIDHLLGGWMYDLAQCFN